MGKNGIIGLGRALLGVDLFVFDAGWGALKSENGKEMDRVRQSSWRRLLRVYVEKQNVIVT